MGQFEFPDIKHTDAIKMADLLWEKVDVYDCGICGINLDENNKGLDISQDGLLLLRICAVCLATGLKYAAVAGMRYKKEGFGKHWDKET